MPGAIIACTRASSCNQGFVAGLEYFVAVTIGEPDAGTSPAEVYVNGVQFDQTTASVPKSNAQAPLYLGYANPDTNYGSERFFKGRIRDVRVYERELGPAEVEQLFLNG